MKILKCFLSACPQIIGLHLLFSAIAFSFRGILQVGDLFCQFGEPARGSPEILLGLFKVLEFCPAIGRQEPGYRVALPDRRLNRGCDATNRVSIGPVFGNDSRPFDPIVFFQAIEPLTQLGG